MRRAFIFILIAIILGEVYTFFAVKTVVKARWMLWAYAGISLFIIAFIIWSFTQYDRTVGPNKRSLFTVGLMLLTVVPKMIVGIILLGEDVFRIIGGLIRSFLGNEEQSFLQERRKFVSQVALGLAAIPFLSLLYGMKWGKYNYKVRKETIYFPDLPENFDGMTITQISDIHSGSFDDAEEIGHAIDLVNQQNSDLILFTGDIVNTHAEEMHPWIEAFKRIESAPLGKYSVLGNHDYGEYVEWPSQKAKLQNFEDIKDLHRQIDFKLLLNEHVKIEKGGQEIMLVGVENWGVNFKQAGDLSKASQGLTPEDFKILMSHDPSHWEAEVKNHKNNYHLTLSGHTHGLQFGIEIPGFFKWSPVEYVYKQWAGLYENVGRYVYVNRGFGFHGYPGRVGIWPEITVIELKKGQKVS
ncbi:phosphoesterase [Flavobacterium album]|uniref:Phosphoesterase n=1 Tax=Flavobacterium album TaxID=2175091 RepID=A0A2S1QUB1_9FLAO|nr:metallophosphoesterase [Flavobacterium album]AWH83997.1 phosphoesterase [Flavobacterium album]